MIDVPDAPWAGDDYDKYFNMFYQCSGADEDEDMKGENDD